MAIHIKQSQQFIPISLEEAWDFFSSPKNLMKITPKKMAMEITNGEPAAMFEGQIVTYRVKPVLGIPLHWVTEITHVEPLSYFIDEQRFGPYAFWHHLHRFKKVDGGVLMTDILHYKMPLGILGKLAHILFVKNQVRRIFEHREKVLTDFFD